MIDEKEEYYKKLDYSLYCLKTYKSNQLFMVIAEMRVGFNEFSPVCTEFGKFLAQVSLAVGDFNYFKQSLDLMLKNLEFKEFKI